MKSLLLLRHLKAAKAGPGMADRDRPLSARGRADAAGVLRLLASAPVSPTLVLCSPAARTRETLDLIRPALPSGATIRLEDDLYGGGAAAILAALASHGERHRGVLVVGHNPDVHDLALRLAGSGEGAILARLQAGFPTGALATLVDVADGWTQLRPGSFRLAALATPAKG